jgi:hypothetical protein
MCLIDECGMLVDELRDDPAFKDALAGLRDAITDALAATDTRGITGLYGEVAKRLVEVIKVVDAQR